MTELLVYLVVAVIVGSSVVYVYHKDERHKRPWVEWGWDDSVVAAGLFLFTGAIWPVVLLLALITTIIQRLATKEHP